MLVLIVDSSAQIIERMEEIISDTGNITAIHGAVSYPEAKKLFNENKHDAVLLDIDLPGNDSLKLLEEIKKTRKKTCVIIQFTHINRYIQERCKSLGADFFIDKYYDFEKIGGLLNSIPGINTIEDLSKKK